MQLNRWKYQCPQWATLVWDAAGQVVCLSKLLQQNLTKSVIFSSESSSLCKRTFLQPYIPTCVHWSSPPKIQTHSHRLDCCTCGKVWLAQLTHASLQVMHDESCVSSVPLPHCGHGKVSPFPVSKHTTIEHAYIREAINQTLQEIRMQLPKRLNKQQKSTRNTPRQCLLLEASSKTAWIWTILC
jgi:hypothetical protein